MSQEKQIRYIPILTAVLALMGAFGGSYLTHLLTSARESRSTVAKVRAEAYAAFFQGQALLWSAEADEAQRTEANKIIKNAKLQIVMVSSLEVISTMNRFWQRHHRYPPCESPGRYEDDAMIYQAIRAESLKALGVEHSEIPQHTLVPFLFNCNLPRTSKAWEDK